MKNEDGFAEDKHRGGRASQAWAVHRSGHSSRPTTMRWFRTFHREAMGHAALSNGQGTTQCFPHQVSSKKQD